MFWKVPPHRPLAAALALAALLGSASLLAAQETIQEPPPAAEPAARPDAHDPLFLGYGTEPGMAFGGRTVASLAAAADRGLGDLFRAGRHPGAVPAWEFPVGYLFLLVQHEVVGHGGRAREQGLGASYGIQWDLSAYTATGRPPATNEGIALLSAGGSEADGVLAHGILLDALRPEGTDGAKLPLALMAKLDLTRYVFLTGSPTAGDARKKGGFVDQYRTGNDVAGYLVARQGARAGAAAADVWDGLYEPDLADPLLRRTYRAARATAIWNLLDPSLAAAMIGYFRDHVGAGSARAAAPTLRLGGLGFSGLSVGTRGALGPAEVTRFLDLYARTGRGVWDVYVRDLDSSVDRSYGAGAALHGLPLGARGWTLGLAADLWREPAAEERAARRDGWNAGVTLAAPLGGQLDFRALAGAKSAGFFPGLPEGSGGYFGIGLQTSF